MARGLVEEHGYTLVPPFDDEKVIAGQGTVGLEILRQVSGSLHAVFVPVGGGGLIAGVAACVKSLRPSVRVIGVEPEEAPCMTEALRRQRRVTLKQVGIFADGVAVRQAGKEPYRIARKYVDDMILVSTDEICAATKDIFDDTRAMVEPAGALAVDVGWVDDLNLLNDRVSTATWLIMLALLASTASPPWSGCTSRIRTR